jgi:hypothetical protein
VGDANVANAAAGERGIEHGLAALMFFSHRLRYCMDGNGNQKASRSTIL